MGAKRSSLTYRRLRAPRVDGQVLLEPSWGECLQHPERNRRLCDNLDFSILGRSYQTLRRSSREHLLRLAKQYTAAYLDVTGEIPGDTDQLIVMSGHQPKLFHPGVWAKNFAVARLAEHVSGVGVHVIIDNDSMREHSLHVPTGTKQSPTRAIEAFDRFSQPMPFEVREVIDRELLSSTPARVASRVEHLVREPLIAEIWPWVMRAVDRGKPLGAAFAEARHLLEYRWGLRTLEVPLSLLCETEPFRWLAFSMMVQGEKLTDSYNTRLGEYRALHGLRNAAQPLPDLRREDGWTESPFWLWLKGQPSPSQGEFRRAVWWKLDGKDLLIRGQGLGKCWTLHDALNTPESAFDEFQHLCDQTLSLRPRALTNTIFLRLFASDAFVHGIGGAKYDQITDLIMTDFWGVNDSFSTPQFIALSQTTLLPLEIDLVLPEHCVKQRKRLREMYFHPEAYLTNEIRDIPQVSCIAKKKLKLIETKPVRGEAKLWQHELSATNAKLREFLQKITEKEHEILRDLLKRQKSSSILGSREWSFALFPAHHLRTRLLDLCRVTP